MKFVYKFCETKKKFDSILYLSRFFSLLDNYNLSLYYKKDNVAASKERTGPITSGSSIQAGYHIHR